MSIAPLTHSLSRVFGPLSSPMPRPGWAAAGSAAALLVLAPAAHAVVVVSPAANIPIPVTTAGIYINVVTGAAGTAGATSGWDINPWGNASLQMWAPSSGGGGIVTSGGSFAALPAGAIVGPASTFADSPSGASGGSGWVLGAENYFGFSFLNEGNGQIHYGYGIISVGSSFNAAGRSVVNLFYESQPGVAITTAPIPEPSTYALMIGGLAAMGAWGRRRRARPT